MILIAEPVHFAATHIQVNSAFVALLRHCFKDKPCVVYAEREHCNELQRCIGEDLSPLSFNTYKQYSRAGRFFWLQKIVGEWRQVWTVFRKVKKEKPEVLFWLSLFPTGHLMAQFIHRLFFPTLKQVIILHGEMEYLAQKDKKNSETFLRKVLKYALKLSNKNTSYIVLGESIKKKVNQIPALQHLPLYAIQHPFLYRYKELAQRQHLPLKIVLFGALNKAKNAHLFYQVAEHFAQEIEQGLLSFHTVGKLAKDLIPYQNNWVNHYKPNEFLAQQAFQQKIAEHDVALFFYEPSMYQYTASGALHEAVNQGLPFLSLQNDYFSYVISNNRIGKCVNSLEDIIMEINYMIHQENDRFAEFHAQIIMFIQQNSFHLQAEKLSRILKEASIL